MRYAYYPGCSLDATGIEYNLSTKLVAKHLGLELWEIPDWNCCGASAAHNTNHLLSLALPARNLAIAEKEGLDVTVPCAACYNRMRTTELAVRHSAKHQKDIAEIIEMDYGATNLTLSLLDVMANHIGTEKIHEKAVKPLTGLKVASYYGCLLVRPVETTGFDDPENPQSMDRVVESIGATSVEWSFKVECCGAGHTTTLPKAAGSMLGNIFEDAKENGADCIAVACPLCFLNLDMRQKEVEKVSGKKFDLPIFYFTELMGLAFGYGPKELGLAKHFVNGLPLLEGKDVLRHPTTRREEA